MGRPYQIDTQQFALNSAGHQRRIVCPFVVFRPSASCPSLATVKDKLMFMAERGSLVLVEQRGDRQVFGTARELNGSCRCAEPNA